jgi:hypothetical protein
LIAVPQTELSIGRARVSGKLIPIDGRGRALHLPSALIIACLSPEVVLETIAEVVLTVDVALKGTLEIQVEGFVWIALDTKTIEITVSEIVDESSVIWGWQSEAAAADFAQDLKGLSGMRFGSCSEEKMIAKIARYGGESERGEGRRDRAYFSCRSSQRGPGFETIDWKTAETIVRADGLKIQMLRGGEGTMTIKTSAGTAQGREVWLEEERKFFVLEGLCGPERVWRKSLGAERI